MTRNVILSVACFAFAAFANGNLYAQVEVLEIAPPATEQEPEIYTVPTVPTEIAEPEEKTAPAVLGDPEKKDCFYYTDAPKTDVSWESPRLLDNLNNLGSAEAYPYLSEDGLRLYFSRQGDEGLNLYMASRKSIYDAFANRQPLGDNIPDGAFSGWLSNDERELYYSDGDVLHYAFRNSLSDPFSAPADITLLGLEIDFVSGPSLTPDKQELYVYRHNDYKSIIRLKKTGVMEYTFVDELEIPAGLSPGPGQLSKNGLAYYFSLEAGGQDRLFKYSRAALDAPWHKLEALDGIFCDTEIQPAQPSVSMDEQIFACVSTSEDSWENNDLSVSTAVPHDPASTPGPTDDIELAVEQPATPYGLGTRVYPNPTDAQVTLAIDEVGKDASYTLYDINGRELQRQLLNASQTAIDMASLPGGIYFLKVVQKNTVELVKVIKR